MSPITQAQLTFPVTLSKETGREDVVWLALACRLLETRVLQRLRFEWGEVGGPTSCQPPGAHHRRSAPVCLGMPPCAQVYTCSVAPFFGCEAPSNKGESEGTRRGTESVP